MNVRLKEGSLLFQISAMCKKSYEARIMLNVVCWKWVDFLTSNIVLLSKCRFQNSTVALPTLRGHHAKMLPQEMKLCTVDNKENQNIKWTPKVTKQMLPILID